MRRRSPDEVKAQAKEFLDQGWLPSPHTPGRFFPADRNQASKMTAIEVWQAMRDFLLARDGLPLR